jgi:formate/nitrite transporter FocA (FNT family)
LPQRNKFATPGTLPSFIIANPSKVTPHWHQIFLRGIGANWLVCLACILGAEGRELVSKIIGIWWPIYAFVSIGLDHVVANMFFVPLGIWQGAPDITVGLYIWKGIIPAGLGNIVGGALFCGAFYWYMYLLQAEPIGVDGVYYEHVDGQTMNHNGFGFRSRKDEESGSSTGAARGEQMGG